MVLNYKKLTTLCPLLLFLLFMTAGSLSAQSIKTTAPGDSLSVGDVFIYSLRLQTDKQYDKIVFPDTSYFLGNIELIEQQQFKINDFTDSLAYKLQFFALEDVVIPPLPVHLINQSDTQRVFSDQVFIPFKTVLPADTSKAELRPLKPVIEFPRLLWPWILGALLLFATFLVWWFYFRKTEAVEEPVRDFNRPVFRNPLLELESRLKALQSDTSLLDSGQYKAFYTELGDAIRAYYEELYEIPALESTSRELIRYLDAYAVDQQLIDLTRKVLNHADRVKFAKYTPTREGAVSTLRQAFQFKERASEVDSQRIHRRKQEFNAQYQPESDHGQQKTELNPGHTPEIKQEKE